MPYWQQQIVSGNDYNQSRTLRLGQCQELNSVTVCHQFYTVSTVFQYVSESPSRLLCSCGSVSMMLLLYICRNSVSRSKAYEGAHGYGLHLLDVFSYRG